MEGGCPSIADRASRAVHATDVAFVRNANGNTATQERSEHDVAYK